MRLEQHMINVPLAQLVIQCLAVIGLLLCAVTMWYTVVVGYCF